MHESIATRLDHARARRSTLPPIRETWPALGIEDAYAVQDYLTRMRLARGGCLVGRKIGLTSPAVQRQLGVDQPDYGMLFDDMRVPEGGTIPLATLIQPKIEGEIAFVMAHPLDSGQVDELRFAGAVRSAHAALEIVDSRIERWNIGIVDTVADNASSALFAMTQRGVPLAACDPAAVTMRLLCDGEIVSSGEGRACLGNPLTAAAWLASRMIALGRPLAPGDIVLSGALGPMVTLQPGRRWTLDCSGFDTLTLSS
jgi:2-keto-4-pentenoate hydratase